MNSGFTAVQKWGIRLWITKWKFSVMMSCLLDSINNNVSLERGTQYESEVPFIISIILSLGVHDVYEGTYLGQAFSSFKGGFVIHNHNLIHINFL